MTSSSSEGSGDGLVKGISMRDSGSLARGGARALFSLNCHYDSIISSSGAPCIRQPTIEEIHIDCTHLVLD